MACPHCGEELVRKLTHRGHRWVCYACYAIGDSPHSWRWKRFAQ